MKFTHLQRLAKVQAHLKPVLDTLGLQAKFAHSWNRREISFFNDDGSVMHSAQLSLRDHVRSTENILAGAKLTVWDVGERDIGNNGWKYSYINEALYINDLEGDTEESFKIIEACLLEHKTVRVGNSHEKVFDDSTVAEVFEKLTPFIRKISQEPINFDRTDDVLSFSFFERSCADTWKVAFEYDALSACSAVLYVNDQKIGAAPADVTQVRELVKRTISKFNLNTDRYYPFGPGR